ncbi:MAG: hypothetical protein KC426_10130, partial [Oceanospirillaceae bacterium]|nr:hypothetical protein [Oceanospirillaceae bacterium]
VEPKPVETANTSTTQTTSDAPIVSNKARQNSDSSARQSTDDYADYHMAQANSDTDENTHHWHDEHYQSATLDHHISPEPTKHSFNALLPKVQNPAHAAIRVILRHPEAVEPITKIPSHLSELKMQDAGVLIQLLSTVQTMHKQLKRWPNPAELHIECASWDSWPMLRQLAALESLLPQGNYPQQLEQAISRLLGHHFDERYAQILQLASQPNADASIKKQLKELLKEKEELQTQLKGRQ